MILEQQIWKAKKGYREDLAALLKAEGQRMGMAYRVYTPLTHPSALIIIELEFSDLAEHAKFWSQWQTEPESQAYLLRLHALVEPEHRTELFRVL